MYHRSIPAAVVDGFLGVAARGSEMFMMSEQPNGVFVTATVARNYGELVEVDWTFPSTLNRYAGCNCAWTHCAADISDTFDWKPHRKVHASFLHRAAVEAPDGEAQEENSSLGPLNDEASWLPCKTDAEGLPVGRGGFYWRCYCTLDVQCHWSEVWA